jgi:hypothetical protein
MHQAAIVHFSKETTEYRESLRYEGYRIRRAERIAAAKAHDDQALRPHRRPDHLDEGEMVGI